MTRKILSVLILTLVILFLTGCSALDKYVKDMEVQPEESQIKPWTIMLYVAADLDKDLAKMLLEEVEAVLKVGSTGNAHVVAQIDYEGKKAEAERYYVYRKKLARRAKLGKINMGDPGTLESFLEWGMSYPSEKKALIVMGRGTGWISLNQVKSRSFAYSDTENDSITLFQAKEVFEKVLNGKKIDVLAFNSGFMNQLEVAYQLKDYAKYMVAAETDMPGIGFDYSMFLHPLKEKNTDALEFSKQVFVSGQAKHLFMVKRANDILKKIKDNYHNWDSNDHYVPEIPEKICKKIINSSYQIALIDMQEVENFGQKVSTFVDSMTSLSDENREEFKYAIDFARKNSAGFAPLFSELNGKKEYIDMNDFLLELYNKVKNEEVSQNIVVAVEALYKVVLDTYYRGDNVKYSMTSVYFPENFEIYDRILGNIYSNLDWTQDTGWNKFLQEVRK